MVYEISTYLSPQKVDLKEIKFIEPTLEDVFITLTKKELRD